MSGMGSGIPPAHKPTLGYAIGGVIVAIVVYHFTLGKGRK
jgi:hypothetical protein